MDRNSNKYTFIYSIVLVVVVAAILTFVAVGLGPKQVRNVELEKKSNILQTINIVSTTTDVEQLFNKYIIDAFAVDISGNKVEGIEAFKVSVREELKKEAKDQCWPVYIAKLDDGSVKYIFSLDGKGLWGGIWGYISFDEDLNTVYGVNFDHKSETPGLGAEIALPNFQNQFKGKQIFENNSFVSIDVTKKDTKNNIHAVDAISGGTITSNGVKKMLNNCLNSYLKYIDKIKNN